MFKFIYFTASMLCWIVMNTDARQFSMPDHAVPITQSEIKLLAESLGDVMEKGYVDKTKGKAVKELLAKYVRDKKYKSITTVKDAVDQLIKDTQSIIHDKHFNMLYIPKSTDGFSWVNEGEQDANDREKIDLELFEKHRRVNFGLPKVEVLEGNIGYLKVSWFNSPAYWLKKPLADAFSFLQHTDALILDVRNNPGGTEESVTELVSYFFSERTKVLLSTSHEKLSDIHLSYFTDPNPIGPKYLSRPVTLLTSASTASAGEMIAYHMKHFGKATIIGENTMGAANGFNTVKIGPDHLGNIMVMLPDTYVEHAVTKSNWEKTGVSPDISVLADEALYISYKLLLEKLRDATSNNEKKNLYDRLLLTAASKLKPTPETPAYIAADYVGKYDIRSVFIEGNLIYFQRENGPKVRMNYIGNDQFELDIEMTPKPIISFKREAGKITFMTMKSAGGEIIAPRSVD